MSFVYSLCSSSKGNATYFGTRESGILIDAGLSLRSFSNQLAFYNIEPAAVKGIFITHEHSDHIKGLKTIGGKLGVPIYGSRETLEYLIINDFMPTGVDAVEISKKTAEIADMSVTAFTTPHDSVHSLGYKMTFADGKTASLCTDLGCVTERVYDSIKGSEFVLLESNYDDELLRNGSYPFFLKKRIDSSTGHLSNAHCALTLINLFNDGTTKFMLGHLSEQNNRPELAFQSALSALLMAGAEINRDYILSVAKRQSLGEVVEV